jgi:hypothetical protein
MMNQNQGAGQASHWVDPATLVLASTILGPLTGLAVRAGENCRACRIPHVRGEHQLIVVRNIRRLCLRASRCASNIGMTSSI